MSKIIKWGSIEHMHNILRWLEGRKEAKSIIPPIVNYQPKIKLHGTNGGVQITPDGEVLPQGRRSLLSIQDDNAGFAKWVKSEEPFFKSVRGIHPLTIFGEWCGPGIQKGTAINQIPKKIFAIFAIRIEDKMIVDPILIKERLVAPPESIRVIPWLKTTFVIDWNDREDTKIKADSINRLVEEVERSDPWVRVEFGIEGTGEGIVLYPILGPLPKAEEVKSLMFKAKGEKHKVIKTKKSAQIDPEVAKSIDEFVDMFVTPTRLDQALEEGCGGKVDTKLTGDFLKWIHKDILKESESELNVSGLKWKQVVKPISQKSVKWYQERVKEI